MNPRMREETMLASFRQRAGLLLRVIVLVLMAGYQTGCGDLLHNAATPPLAPESAITIENGNPGMASLSVTINGQEYRVAGLRPNEVRTIDVSAARALNPGGSTASANPAPPR
jgi:hypothetical protein